MLHKEVKCHLKAALTTWSLLFDARGNSTNRIGSKAHVVILPTFINEIVDIRAFSYRTFLLDLLASFNDLETFNGVCAVSSLQNRPNQLSPSKAGYVHVCPPSRVQQIVLLLMDNEMLRKFIARVCGQSFLLTTRWRALHSVFTLKLRVDNQHRSLREISRQ